MNARRERLEDRARAIGRNAIDMHAAVRRGPRPRALSPPTAIRGNLAHDPVKSIQQLLLSPSTVSSTGVRQIKNLYKSYQRKNFTRIPPPVYAM